MWLNQLQPAGSNPKCWNLIGRYVFWSRTNKDADVGNRIKRSWCIKSHHCKISCGCDSTFGNFLHYFLLFYYVLTFTALFDKKEGDKKHYEMREDPESPKSTNPQYVGMQHTRLPPTRFFWCNSAAWLVNAFHHTNLFLCTKLKKVKN